MNAQSFALNTPRNIALALKPKVHAELECIERLGVITRVSEPRSWCAAMVVVPKSCGAVCICLDMKSLNENVLQEVHPMPKVDYTLSKVIQLETDHKSLIPSQNRRAWIYYLPECCAKDFDLWSFSIPSSTCQDSPYILQILCLEHHLRTPWCSSKFPGNRAICASHQSSASLQCRSL